jgi:D-glycero-alpha-D-manno-heptose 1-phosphate guanylyltransferase
MEAVVLAGGQGKRLRQAVPGLPKSLAPIGTQPFLNYLLGWLRTQQITEVILAVGHRRKAIIDYYARHRPGGMRLLYSVEYSPLGTGGALRNVRSLLSGDEFLVLNGDSIFDVDLAKMHSFHRKQKSVTTLALASLPKAGRYGSVVLNGDNRIKAFLEKPEGDTFVGDKSSSPRWISGGVYIMTQSVFQVIPENQEVSLEKEVFPRLIGNRFYGFQWDGYFIDIGVPEDYRRAQDELPARFTPC